MKILGNERIAGAEIDSGDGIRPPGTTNPESRFLTSIADADYRSPIQPAEPVQPPSEGPVRKGRNRYDGLEPEQLFHVIDDLEGSKSRGRIREFIWVSIIAHMLLFWYLAYGPRYFGHVQVVNPADRLKPKDFTYLDTPEVLKKLKPKDSRVLSNQDRTAETRKPTIDRKTIEQLKAMRKAETPALQPAAPEQAQQQPAPQQPQTAPQPAQPLPSTQQSQLDAPKPAPTPTTPSFNTGPSTPGEAIRQAARDAAKSPSIVGESGNSHGGTAGNAEILTDTMGVDFDPYLKRIIRETQRAWDPLVPESVRTLNKRGKVMIRFKILRDGSVKEMILEGPSGDVSLDRAAWGGITGASPYPPLPKDFKGPFIELRFYFLYNIKPGQE